MVLLLSSTLRLQKIIRSIKVKTVVIGKKQSDTVSSSICSALDNHMRRVHGFCLVSRDLTRNTCFSSFSLIDNYQSSLFPFLGSRFVFLWCRHRMVCDCCTYKSSSSICIPPESVSPTNAVPCSTCAVALRNDHSAFRRPINRSFSEGCN